jgi:hypothetical protein
VFFQGSRGSGLVEEFANFSIAIHGQMAAVAEVQAIIVLIVSLGK